MGTDDLKTVKVRPETHAALVRKQGELASSTGAMPTLDEVITDLLEHQKGAKRAAR